MCVKWGWGGGGGTYHIRGALSVTVLLVIRTARSITFWLTHTIILIQKALLLLSACVYVCIHVCCVCIHVCMCGVYVCCVCVCMFVVSGYKHIQYQGSISKSTKGINSVWYVVAVISIFSSLPCVQIII